MVRNGDHPKRDIVTGIGSGTGRIPKVRRRVGAPVAFRSARVPPYVRRSRSLAAAIPWLYLKGVAAGDGALGFWAALDEGYPSARQPRCWVHKTANVLNCLPKSSQAKAQRALQEIRRAETRENARRAFGRFLETYQAKEPKAANCLPKDRQALLAFYDFPAEPWVHLRTTNPIESTFATIRPRTARAKGCVPRDTMLAMIFKLGLCAQGNWRKIRGFKKMAQVIEGVRFINGIEADHHTDPCKRAA